MRLKSDKVEEEKEKVRTTRKELETWIDDILEKQRLEGKDI